jgi:hypothetical protein
VLEDRPGLDEYRAASTENDTPKWLRYVGGVVYVCRMERNTMNNNNTYGNFVYSVLESVVGNAKEYFVSESTVATVWAECHANDELNRLAGKYLVADSASAPRYYEELRSAIIVKFRLAGLA